MVNGELLKFYIAKAGFTNAELAKKIDIAPATLSLKVKNKREFTVSETNCIRKILNLTGDEMLLVFHPSNN